MPKAQDPLPGRIVILGAGPCGLACASELDRLGHRNWTLLEASPTVGGLASSVVDRAGFTWDLGATWSSPTSESSTGSWASSSPRMNCCTTTGPRTSDSETAGCPTLPAAPPLLAAGRRRSVPAVADPRLPTARTDPADRHRLRDVAPGPVRKRPRRALLRPVQHQGLGHLTREDERRLGRGASGTGRPRRDPGSLLRRQSPRTEMGAELHVRFPLHRGHWRDLATTGRPPGQPSPHPSPSHVDRPERLPRATGERGGGPLRPGRSHHATGPTRRHDDDEPTRRTGGGPPAEAHHRRHGRPRIPSPHPGRTVMVLLPRGRRAVLPRHQLQQVRACQRPRRRHHRLQLMDDGDLRDARDSGQPACPGESRRCCAAATSPGSRPGRAGHSPSGDDPVRLPDPHSGPGRGAGVDGAVAGRPSDLPSRPVRYLAVRDRQHGPRGEDGRRYRPPSGHGATEELLSSQDAVPAGSRS